MNYKNTYQSTLYLIFGINIENQLWAAYKEKDGHQRDGFILFCMRLVSWAQLHHNFILRVTFFLLVDTPWWILCLPWQNTMKYTKYMLIFTNPQSWWINERLPYIIYNGTTYTAHTNFKEICHLLKLWRFVMRQWQLCFAMLFTRQTQWNICNYFSEFKPSVESTCLCSVICPQ